MKKVFLGADHRGYELKNKLKVWLKEKGYEAVDLGNTEYDAQDDYPDFVWPVAKAVSKEPESRGVVICGSGVGATVVANKAPGARAAEGWRTDQVHHARAFDDVNILALASDYLSLEEAQELITTLLETDFAGEERLVRRLKKIQQIEKTNS